MSAAVSPVRPGPASGSGSSLAEPQEGRASEPQPVVVRRNAGLAALVGGAASAVAIAYLRRASTSGSPLDWALCLVLAGIAALHLTHLVDARTPLLVADHLGVRVRLGNQWRGLPWDAVDQVVVSPSRGLLHDGRLMFSPHSMDRALEGLDARGRRAAGLNQRLYGAALAVPLGLTTRTSRAGRGDRGDGRGDLSEELAALAHGRVDVVTLRPAPAEARVSESPDTAETRGPESPAEVEPVEEGHTPRRRVVGGIGTIVSRVGRSVPSRDPDRELDDPAADPTAEAGATEDEAEPVEKVGPVRPLAAARSTLPMRETRHALRAQITHERPTRVLGSAALLPDADPARRATLPERDQLRRPDHDDQRVHDDTVRPIATLGEPVERLVVDDFVTEPAYDPVIGPELAAARNRVGLSVDELSERTRIRPHVIESIEVDDFAPCGGDFYARGHLRTLARVLGRDAGVLVGLFDERYATAPIGARKVFEAELATGMTGGIKGGRSTLGGPDWALMVGVVLALLLTWGVVRLLAGEPPEQLQVGPVLNGSAGVSAHRDGLAAGGAAAVTPRPVAVQLVGAQDGAQVVVRDRAGTVVWAGRIAPGERRTLHATPPVRVHADDGGAVTVLVDGHEQGALGLVGRVGQRTFVPPQTQLQDRLRTKPQDGSASR